MHIPLLLLEIKGRERRRDVRAVSAMNPVAVATHHDITLRPIANEFVTPLPREDDPASIVGICIPVYVFDSRNLSFHFSTFHFSTLLLHILAERVPRNLERGRSPREVLRILHKDLLHVPTDDFFEFIRGDTST